MKIPKPPYTYKSDQTHSVYFIDKKDIQSKVDFPVFSIFGKTFLVVTSSKYKKASSILEKNKNFAYDEFMLLCPVLVKGRIGITSFDLHLSNKIGVVTGRKFYGFPKKLSKIIISYSKKRIKIKLGNLRVLYNISNGSSLLNLLRPFISNFSLLLKKNGNYIYADFQMKKFNMKKIKLEGMTFPNSYLNFLDGKTPLFSFALKDSEFIMKAPRPIVKNK